MADSPEEIQKSVRTYMKVFAALVVLTVLTWSVAIFIDLGEPGLAKEDIALGLLIATVKASLVALIFMHLNHERPLIYKILVFTTIFVISLVALIYLADSDPLVFFGIEDL